MIRKIAKAVRSCRGSRARALAAISPRETGDASRDRFASRESASTPARAPPLKCARRRPTRASAFVLGAMRVPAEREYVVDTSRATVLGSRRRNRFDDGTSALRALRDGRQQRRDRRRRSRDSRARRKLAEFVECDREPADCSVQDRARPVLEIERRGSFAPATA